MNREIKFRVFAYTDEGNKMVHLGPLECDNGLWFSSNEHLDDYIDKIMQYTGLKDKNRVGIYEGDIVKWGHLENSRENEIRIATVKIDPDIQFDCRNIHYPHIFHFGTFAYGSDQMEVIGNIYEHPQLIAG